MHVRVVAFEDGKPALNFLMREIEHLPDGKTREQELQHIMAFLPILLLNRLAQCRQKFVFSGHRILQFPLPDNSAQVDRLGLGWTIYAAGAAGNRSDALFTPPYIGMLAGTFAGTGFCLISIVEDEVLATDFHFHHGERGVTVRKRVFAWQRGADA